MGGGGVPALRLGLLDLWIRETFRASVRLRGVHSVSRKEGVGDPGDGEGGHFR